MVSVTALPMASCAVPPMACATNFSDTQATLRPASLSSSSQRPYKICESVSRFSSVAALAPLTVAVMVVAGSPYFATVPLPTCWVSSI